MDSFFGIGLPELILILLVAGIVMGPERIGVAARWLGRTTAQLQAVSRSFVRQLNSELDGLTGSAEIKETMREMQELQGELAQLKQQLLSQTNGLTQDAKKAVAQTKAELERTIAPPAASGSTAVPPESSPTAPLAPEELPKRIEVSDDPEP